MLDDGGIVLPVNGKCTIENYKYHIRAIFEKLDVYFSPILRTPSVLIRFHTTNGCPVLWAVLAGDILFYSYTQRYRRGSQKEVDWSMQKYLSFLKIHCSNSLLNKFGIMHYVFHVHDKSPQKRLSTLCITSFHGVDRDVFWLYMPYMIVIEV